MYLNSLNTEQQQIFLGLAKMILIVDGSIDEHEDSIIQEMCREMECTLNDDLPVKYEQLPDKFPSQQDRRIVIIELLHLAYSNYEYHNEEKNLISKVADVLSIDPTVIQEIEVVLKQYVFTRKKLLNIIQGRSK